MSSHQNIFVKFHNAELSAENEIREIFDSISPRLNALVTISKGTPDHAKLLQLSEQIMKFKTHLLSQSKPQSHSSHSLTARESAREFRNIFDIALEPGFSPEMKIKQIKLFGDYVCRSSMSAQEARNKKMMFALGLALVAAAAATIAAIIAACVLMPLAILPVISISLKMKTLILYVAFLHQKTALNKHIAISGGDVCTTMVSLVKNHQHLFAKPKMTEIAPPSYEQARYAMA